MKIYRISQATSEEDMGGLVDNQRLSILDEYFAQGDNHSMMSWSVIPFGLVKKAWTDFSKLGFVRDTGTIDKIADKMLFNLARLQASTDLSGHSQFSIEDYCEEMDLPVIEGGNDDFYMTFLNTPFGCPCSDYGMDPLWDLGFQLISETDYTKKLMLIDRMLQVTHANGDLAALFIEGGTSSLNALSSIGEKNEAV